jgi:hypothetical protein
MKGIQMKLDAPQTGAWVEGQLFDVVTDLDTGKAVGTIEGRHKSTYLDGLPRRTISLFDGKYVGRFDDHAECVAFAKGVEAVLNYLLKHMVSSRLE